MSPIRRWTVAVLAFVAILITVAIIIPPREAFLLLILGGFGLLSFYYLVETSDLFHPFGFIGLVLLLEIVGTALDYYWIDSEDSTAYLLGANHSYLVKPAFIVFIGITALFLGFVVGREKRFGARLPTPPTRIDTHRLMRVAALYAVIGVLFFVLYLWLSEFTFSVGGISAKRTVQSQYIRWGVEFLGFAAIFQFLRGHEQGWSLFSFEAIPLWRLAVGFTLFAFIVSSRGLLIWFWILILVLIHYLRHRIRLLYAAGSASVAVVVAGFMLGLRKVATGAGDSLLTYLNPATAIFAIFDADRGGFTAITHVVNNTPGDLSFRWGQTLLYWVVFPIPRSLWADKPKNLGQTIAPTIYGTSNGTPPLIIGELYWNFAIPGVVVGMFLFGLFAAVAYTYLQVNSENPYVVLFYAILGTKVFVLADMTMTMVQFLKWLLPIGVVVLYISHSRLLQSLDWWLTDDGCQVPRNESLFVRTVIHSSAVRFVLGFLSFILAVGSLLYLRLARAWQTSRCRTILGRLP